MLGTALYAYAEHATTMFESGPGGAGAGTDSTGPATADAVTFGAWAGLAPATPTPLLTALPTGHLAGADTGITGARLGTAIETLRDAGDTGGVREMVGTTVGTTRRREVLDDPTGNLAGPDRSVNLAGPGPRTATLTLFHYFHISGTDLPFVSRLYSYTNPRAPCKARYSVPMHA